MSTANQVFDIFDGAKEGVLHVKDLSAGLAMLCDGSLATSVRSACRLYEVADGRMGFADICGFTLSIFKVFSGHQLFPHANIETLRALWHVPMSDTIPLLHHVPGSTLVVAVGVYVSGSDSSFTRMWESAIVQYRDSQSRALAHKEDGIGQHASWPSRRRPR